VSFLKEKQQKTIQVWLKIFHGIPVREVNGASKAAPGPALQVEFQAMLFDRYALQTAKS